MPRLLRTEQEHHRLAFERYYEMGAGRSYEAVAQAIAVSAATVKLWGRSFSWLARVRERDNKAAAQIAEQTAADHIHATNRNLKIVRAGIIHIARDVAEGNLKQIRELRNLVHLEEHLMGVTQVGQPGQSAAPGVVLILPDNGMDNYPATDNLPPTNMDKTVDPDAATAED
jgi:hypothetical protein